MKGKNIFIISLLSVLITMAAGCSKSNPTVFSWDYDYMHYVATSSSISDSSYKILAIASNSDVAINMGTKPIAGSYTVHPQNNSGQPFLLYVQVSSYLYSQSGTITISYSDNTKISGSFTVTFTDGSVMTGAFSDIPYQ
jgi:hypothetical protein